MYRLLLIEDNTDDAEVFIDTITRMNLAATTKMYDLKLAKTYREGMDLINEDFCGVIVDIRLDEGHSGNDIINEITQNHRIPAVIFTGTPDTEQGAESPIVVYKKGEALHSDIVLDLCSASDTGLTNILGRTGVLETVINRVFWRNLFPQMRLWKEKKEAGIDTEKALLRYIVAHIQELIDEQLPAYVTEEMYIRPPISKAVKTGSIIRAKSDGLFCIVLSPPCDLAEHHGTIKTNCILVCEIESQAEVNSTILHGVTKKDKQKRIVESALNNNYNHYYHWLPKNTLFDGGYINFRKVITYTPEELHAQYEHPFIKVQEGFVKSILGRFSAYYARQGQPDFNFDAEADEILG